MKDVFLAQLASMRALIGSLQAQVDGFAQCVEVAFEPTAPQACQHTGELEDVGSFQDVQKRCVACGAIVETSNV